MPRKPLLALVSLAERQLPADTISRAMCRLQKLSLPGFSGSGPVVWLLLSVGNEGSVVVSGSGRMLVSIGTVRNV